MTSRGGGGYLEYGGREGGGGGGRGREGGGGGGGGRGEYLEYETSASMSQPIINTNVIMQNTN